MAHPTAENSVPPTDPNPESCGFLATPTEPVAPRSRFHVPNHLLPQTFYQLCMITDSILLTQPFPPDNGPRRGRNLESPGARNLNPLTDPNPGFWSCFTLSPASQAACQIPLIGAAFFKAFQSASSPCGRRVGERPRRDWPGGWRGMGEWRSCGGGFEQLCGGVHHVLTKRGAKESHVVRLAEGRLTENEVTRLDRTG
jgi:hypothetical protein